MPLIVGPVGGCDCCCPCGDWCSDGSCGNLQGWQGTNLGIADAGGCPDCGFMNVTVDHSQFIGSISAAEWNQARSDFFDLYGVAMAGEDAKDGTSVCQWASTSSAPSACGVASWALGTMSIYQAADDTWHRYASGRLTDGILNKIGYFDGDVSLGGTGGTQDCGDPDAPATTITDGTAWAYKYVESEGAIPEPTWAACTPPSATIWENIPGGAV